MGTYRQTVVDLDAAQDQAEERAERARRWLLSEGYIRAVPWRGDVAHLSGPRWREAVELPAWDSRAGSQDQEREREPCGEVELITGRTVFLAGPYPHPSAICPHCHDATADWPMEAVSTWHGTGTAAFPCPSCTRTVPLPDWTWTDDYFAFAHLGVQFDDWPPLAPGFTAALARALGTRVRVPRGKW